MPAAPFSRLQLAAALIEYDNDNDDPTKPHKSAQESAIFLPFRNRPIRPPPAERRSTDYLGVNLPNETASIAPSARPRSRASVDALRNPFGRDSTYDGGLEEEEEEEDLEVDLASWGLDAIIPKDKEKEKSKRKRNKSDVLPNPHDALPNPHDTLPNPHDGPARTVRPPHLRTMSGNLLNGLGEGGAFLDSQTSTPNPLGARRHSIGDPLSAPNAYSDEPILPPRTRSPSAHALIDSIPTTPPLHAVPFPSSETVRSPSPQVDDRRRTLSLGSRAMFNDEHRSTTPDRASRFDPMGAHGRTYSSGSIGKMLDEQPEDDNPFALRPPSPSRMSRFDPKAQRARTMSHGTLATQQMMLDDGRSEFGARPPMGEKRYSRAELMRPKVLIMPSPLQGTSTTPASTPALQAREGFELTTDGRPLPPGARAARRSSATLSILEPGLSAPIPSNSFTPNPRASLTLSQLTFRNQLLVDGQRDVAYADIDNHLRRATEDGQKIELEPEPEPEPQPEVPIVHVDDLTGPKRPAGKLYGRSLIDDLESRKAEMRGKQRVFRGDDRPSMMARTQPVRSSTLIDPEELKRPASQHLNSFHSQPDLSRRNSTGAKPLLEFDEDIPGAPRQSLYPGGGVAGNTKSVFGVDTIWERELAKLKLIEEQERQAEEERKRREAVEEAKNSKKRGKKKKGKGKATDDQPVSPAPEQTPSPGPAHTEDAAPVLPAIPRATVRRAPPPPGDDDDDSDDDSDSSDAPAPPRAAQASGWHSDEEEGPRRTTGTGPRYPNMARTASGSGGPPRLPQIAREDEESSEEDVPLVATIGRAAQRQARSRVGSGDGDSSDEEQPLSVLLDKTKQKLPSIGGSLSPRSPANDNDDEDEDDQPLGLRVSRFGGSYNPSLVGGGDGDEDEDDKPLGLHPDQLRKTQYFMAAGAQQQQQMLAQAQMAQMAAAHQSMIFGAPSMMSSGFFGPPMGPVANPMMMGMGMGMPYPPQLPPTPPPIQDAAKFGRVDKWRHDVAVEGERS